MPPAEGLAHSPCRPALSASHPGPVTLPRPLGPGESYFRRSRSLCQSSTLTPLSLQPSQPGWWLLRALHTRPHQRAAPQARPASDRAAALQDHRSTYRELDHRPLDLTTQAHVTVSHPHPPQKARHHWASTLQSHHCIGATLLVTWKRIYFITSKWVDVESKGRGCQWLVTMDLVPEPSQLGIQSIFLKARSPFVC